MNILDNKISVVEKSEIKIMDLYCNVSKMNKKKAI